MGGVLALASLGVLGLPRGSYAVSKGMVDDGQVAFPLVLPPRNSLPLLRGFTLNQVGMWLCLDAPCGEPPTPRVRMQGHLGEGMPERGVPRGLDLTRVCEKHGLQGAIGTSPPGMPQLITADPSHLLPFAVPSRATPTWHCPGLGPGAGGRQSACSSHRVAGKWRLRPPTLA